VQAPRKENKLLRKKTRKGIKAGAERKLKKARGMMGIKGKNKT